MIDTDKYEGHQVSDFKTSVAGPNHTWVTHQQRHGHVEALLLKHATAALVTDAPLLLAEVKRLRRVLELIGENMEYHSWMHTLIKEAIGFEKWQAKEMVE